MSRLPQLRHVDDPYRPTRPVLSTVLDAVREDPAWGPQRVCRPAAVRETLEEPGIECEVTGLVGIYSDPRHVILYTSNSEARQEFSIVLTARALSGRPTPSSKSSEVRWIPAAEAVGYAMDRSMRIRINDFLARKKSPVIT